MWEAADGCTSYCCYWEPTRHHCAVCYALWSESCFKVGSGANAIAGRHNPGIFTNQMQTSFSGPRTGHRVKSNFELMSLFSYTTDGFVLTWKLWVSVCCCYCRPLRKVLWEKFESLLSVTDSPMRFVEHWYSC